MTLDVAYLYCINLDKKQKIRVKVNKRINKKNTDSKL